MIFLFGPTCKYTRTNRDREKEEKTKRERERGYVRTRSENSQPTPEATNFCRSAIAARRQLLLMWLFLPRQNAAVLFGKQIKCCPAKQVALVNVLTAFGLW